MDTKGGCLRAQHSVNLNGSSDAEEAQKRIVRRRRRKQLQNFAYELHTNFY